MESKVNRLRLILKFGASVFGLSAVALVAFPGFFNQLLGLTTNPALEWSMRMTGITLVALAGNMFAHSIRGTNDSVLLVGKIMSVSAALLGVLTLFIPSDQNWFTISYALVGFTFSTLYTVTLITREKK